MFRITRLPSLLVRLSLCLLVSSFAKASIVYLGAEREIARSREPITLYFQLLPEAHWPPTVQVRVDDQVPEFNEPCFTTVNTQTMRASCAFLPLQSGRRELRASVVAGDRILAERNFELTSASLRIVPNLADEIELGQSFEVLVELDIGRPTRAVDVRGRIEISDGFDRCQIDLPASPPLKCALKPTRGGYKQLRARWLNAAQVILESETQAVTTTLPSEPLFARSGTHRQIASTVSGNVSHSSNRRYSVWRDIEGLKVFDRQLATSRRFIVGSVPRYSGIQILSTSGNGRWITFDADFHPESSLGDRNGGHTDVVLLDQLSGRQRIVSTDSEGVQAELSSMRGTLSDNGRWIAFESKAGNLVPGLTQARRGLYLKSLEDQNLRLVTLDLNNNQDAGFHARLSADGELLVFHTHDSLDAGDLNGVSDVYAYNRSTGRFTWISRGYAAGGAPSHSPKPSLDGRFIAFLSNGEHLVRGDFNQVSDVFVYVVSSGRLVRLEQRLPDRTIPINTHGFCFDRAALVFGWTMYFDLATETISSYDSETGCAAQDSAEANAFDQNYLKAVESLSVRPSPEPIDGVIGSRTSFEVGAYLEPLKKPLRGRFSSAQSAAGGKLLAFVSNDSDLVSGDTNQTDDVFVFDSQSGQIERVSVQDNGAEIPGYFNPAQTLLPQKFGSSFSMISNDGRYVLFETRSPPVSDRFTPVHLVRDRLHKRTLNPLNLTTAHRASISDDFRYVAYANSSSNLIFLLDQQTANRRLLTPPNIGFNASTSGQLLALTSAGEIFFRTNSNALTQASSLISKDFVFSISSAVTSEIPLPSQPQGFSRPALSDVNATGDFRLFSSFRSLSAEPISSLHWLWDRRKFRHLPELNSARNVVVSEAGDYVIAETTPLPIRVLGSRGEVDLALDFSVFPSADARTLKTRVRIQPERRVEHAAREKLVVTDSDGHSCQSEITALEAVCELPVARAGKLDLLATFAGDGVYGYGQSKSTITIPQAQARFLNTEFGQTNGLRRYSWELASSLVATRPSGIVRIVSGESCDEASVTLCQARLPLQSCQTDKQAARSRICYAGDANHVPAAQQL